MKKIVNIYKNNNLLFIKSFEKSKSQLNQDKVEKTAIPALLM